MPGERMPDFRRAAKAVISRALGKQGVPMEPSLDEHAPREAALIERTLQNGPCTPFRHGEVPKPRQVPIGALTGTRQHVPLGELPGSTRMTNDDTRGLAQMVHAVQFNEDLEFPTHLNTGTREFTPKHSDHDFMQYIDVTQ